MIKSNEYRALFRISSPMGQLYEEIDLLSLNTSGVCVITKKVLVYSLCPTVPVV